MSEDTNGSFVVGNLTRDPELRYVNEGTAVCDMRVAYNTRRKNRAGAWVDKANYIDVTTWGNHAKACADHLAKGMKIAVFGQLDYEEWEAKENGGKRSRHKITGKVQFLSFNEDRPSGSDESTDQTKLTEEPAGAEEREPVGAAAGGSEDDIPFG